ncbi:MULTISPECIES: lytic transglycosylase domain-containing protein [unclassified Caballeronia]|uniref:lytic transglycosylase domain-containing protein n=1 Tax=unclassified Caballeronia TaxID=2646786 RepID=UPI001F40F761|nr:MULTISPECIES: lytic transglycosylase domain-containing protein [unclassified Caballeronia]MCE4548092.1 lytic transglycosylase domain-containing protein [Caballeronia sp. PC1]MCE4575746.1 lytic transglycosylase domain-containing protein [Caballeronia sp. CLC5]
MSRIILLAALSAAMVAVAGQANAHAGTSADVMEIAKQCAPNVSPITMGSLVAHESKNNPIAINVNGNYRLSSQPDTKEEAAQIIAKLEASGANFDVGYGQVNSANFLNLGVSGSDLLDPCVNLRASAAVLTACYSRAAQTYGEGQTALLHALSCYNTGSQSRGIANGYVSKVVAHVRALQIPALTDDAGGVTRGAQSNSSSMQQGRAAVERLPMKATAAVMRDPQDLENQGAFSRDDPGAFGSVMPEP